MGLLSKLQHRSHLTPRGVNVIHLEDESKLPPKVLAMLQAKYSRDPKTVLRHVEDIEKAEDRGTKFMADYYVGYNHRSIGRCANVTLFVEGLSMLAAMWLVHTPKFNGQECSTRYLIFETQGNVLGAVSSELAEAQQTSAAQQKMIDRSLAFYSKGMVIQQAHLAKLHPYQGDVSEVQWSKTIKAKALDSLRGFLPTGMRTSVAITMNLCDFEDHVLNLLASPMEEVREIGEAMLKVLREYDSTTFSRTPSDEVIAETRRDIVEMAKLEGKQGSPTELLELSTGTFEFQLINPELWELMRKTYPRKSLPHRDFESGARGRLRVLMDLGTVRDAHRHTSADHRMGLVDVEGGFEEWYVTSLSPELIAEARELIAEITSDYRTLRSQLVNPEDAWEIQYVIPLGFKVQVDMTAGMRSWSYIVPLRAGPMVHPTFRTVMIELAYRLKTVLGLDLGVTFTEADTFNLKRGLQDIVRVGAS